MCPTWRERSVCPLRSSEDEPKTSFNQHQSLSGEILPHFDINNLSAAQKLQKLGIGPFHLKFRIVRYEGSTMTSQSENPN